MKNCLNAKSTIISFLLLIILNVDAVNAQTHHIETDIYFGMNYQSGLPCFYNDGSGCRLYKLSMAIIRSEQTGILSINIIGDSLKQVLPDNVPSVTAGLNSDATLIGFMASGNFQTFSSGKLYAYNKLNNSYKLVSDGTYLSNQNGSWVKWLNDSTCLYSSTNYCPGFNTLPGCGNTFGNRFGDLRSAEGDFSAGIINSHNIVLGDINNLTNLDSRVSSAQDASVNPANPDIIAFHSSSIDSYPSNNGNNASPFNVGQTNIFNNPAGNADPKPVVYDITSTTPSNNIDSLMEGINYWLFDLDSAKINSLVHLHWSPNGNIVAGNEQNTDIYQPYMECIDNPGVQITNASQCSGSNKSSTFERVFGFEKDGSIYKNINRFINDSLPLFLPLPPAQLPNSINYFNPATDICSVYRTKYIEFCGSEKTIVATVMCNNSTGVQNPFSRIMLIDFTIPSNPYYFDITGWVEQNYSNWQPGDANGISTTCHIISDSLLLSMPDVLFRSEDLIIAPNPADNILSINFLPGVLSSGILISDAYGKVVKSFFAVNNQTLSFSIADLSDGMYFITIINGNKIVNKKFLKASHR
ncbi:MAG: T9SS type A sorting domain-containing protein [Bacteroidetes bacterium]|nr:T9SS type A sorting domain-containing protein [Bacteroidota bacterium]